MKYRSQYIGTTVTGHASFVTHNFKEVLQNQTDLYKIVSVLDVGICILTTTGLIRYLNAAALELLSSSSEISPDGMPFWLLLEDTLREEMQSTVNTWTIRPPETDESVRFMSEKGFEIIMKNVTFSEKPFLLLSLSRIPERILSSEQFYRRVVQDQLEFIGHFSVDGRLTFANQAFADYLSVSVSETVDYLISTHIYNEDREAFRTHFYSLTPDQPVETIEHRFVRNNGQVRWHRWTNCAIFDESGKLTMIQGVGHDITEQKHNQFALEQRLHERNQQLKRLVNRMESILNNITDAIVLLDEDHRVDQCNDAFYRMLNVPYDAYFGHTFKTLFDEDEQEHVQRLIMDVLEDRTPRIIETALHPSGAEMLPVELGVSPVMVSSRVESIVCTLRDISERKKVEANLLHMLERERELNELQSRIVTMTSHEFRTPLATIHATSETLRDFSDRMDEQQRIRRFDKIGEQITHMTKMLDDILMVGSLEKDKTALHPEIFDFQTFITSILESLRQIYVDHVFEGTFFTQEPILVRADEKLMIQIIGNLFSNAAKYSSTGSSIRFSVANVDQELQLNVMDDGIGIPMEDLPYIFETFHRGSNATAYKGTGLGLMVAKRAVEAHQGHISVTSASGAGTIFTVTLPILVLNQNKSM